MRKRLLWAAAAIGLLLLLGACAPEASQDTLQPKGPYAEKLNDLFIPVFWVAVFVFVVVEGGIIWISIRYRHRKGRDRIPAQTHGNTKLEIGWTIAPAIILAGVMVPTIAGIWDLARKPPEDALNVTVEGYQWWWGFEYTDDDMQTSYGDNKQIRTADVLVIPEDRVVYLSLVGAGGQIVKDDPADSDYMVIHSFWIPELAGKQDVVPGRTNHILMQADEPGMYEGQCAEFCGLQHGRMLVRVRALSAEDWDAWVANQKGRGVTPTDGQASQGMDLFLGQLSGGRGSCIECHAVGGTDATSEAGPELTHFADPTHECFAGCIWETTDREALEAWLRDPEAVKMGSKMPDYDLTEEEIDALVEYLYSLR
ncbi:MAG TPA: cytochrome c oxidase subunit II [Actinomycetota bacterium]|nr:cytochrome c oxidase subunit II [Actinomycetota bacterium]